MFSYLVTSKTRQELLRLLWQEGVRGSVRELANLAGVSYASAHTELTAMEKFGLATSHGEGKTVVFGANQCHPQAEVLRQLLKAPKQAVASKAHDAHTENVLANLKRLGAPLQTEARLESKLSLEETLAAALAVSRQNAAVLRVLPLVAAMNAGSLDLTLLKARVRELRQARRLGFVLDVAASLSGSHRLKRAAFGLRDRRVKTEEYYFVNARGKFADQLARKNTPRLAKKWHYVVNMPMESFKGLYDKFIDVS